jgi:small acid-soluble spore protein F (minor alpha/beta-type SASP)
MEVDNVGNKNDKLKYEIASELGLLDKVIKFGWKSLSAKETGRIGGMISKRKKAIKLEKGQQM